MMRVLAALLCGLLFHGSLFAQKVRDPEQDKRHYEDNRVENAAERLVQPQESERDRFLKEMGKLRPVDPANEAVKTELDVMFERFSQGQLEWTLDIARRQGIRDIFERVAGRLNVGNGIISKPQFQSYATTYLQPGTSPPWRSPSDDEERAFRQFDANQDGMLDQGEITITLRESLAKFDGNRNGIIERSEYAPYFASRVEVMARKMEENRQARLAKEAARAAQVPPMSAAAPASPAAKPTIATTAANAKPSPVEAIRFGHLPRGLPEWFTQLDLDRDGQVGLYEWRRAGRPPEAFTSLDDNEDGLMTSDEWLRFERSHPEEAAVFAVAPNSKSNDALRMKKSR